MLQSPTCGHGPTKTVTQIAEIYQEAIIVSQEPDLPSEFETSSDEGHQALEV